MPLEIQAIPQPIKQLTPSGEVAVFPDYDQFDGGSVQTCGYSAVVCVDVAAPPGGKVTKSLKDIDAMVDADYVKYTRGPDTRANKNGMALWQLYDDLQAHELKFFPCAMNPDVIIGWLRYGYPVIVAVEESSVHDIGVEDGHTIGCPYPWDTAGLSHVIICTGIGPFGTIKCRDTANIRPPNSLRSGPREYLAEKLRLVSATVVIPRWLTFPPPGFDPLHEPVPDSTIVGHAPRPIVLPIIHAGATERALWWAIDKSIPFVEEHGIPQSWLRALEKGVYLGVPLVNEIALTRNGVCVVEQKFSASFARWVEHEGKTYWYDARGLVFSS